MKRESPRLENLTLDEVHVIAVLACYILLQQTCMISIHGAAFYLCAWPARLESPSLQCLEVVGNPEVAFPAGVAVQQRSTEASILALPWCKQWTQPGAFDCPCRFSVCCTHCTLYMSCFHKHRSDVDYTNIICRIYTH